MISNVLGNCKFSLGDCKMGEKATNTPTLPGGYILFLSNVWFMSINGHLKLDSPSHIFPFYWMAWKQMRCISTTAYCLGRFSIRGHTNLPDINELPCIDWMLWEWAHTLVSGGSCSFFIAILQTRTYLHPICSLPKFTGSRCLKFPACLA